MGSTRWELSHDMRAIWLDLLARAALNDPPGQINYRTLEQIAQFCAAPVRLIRSTLGKCYKHKKIKFKRDKASNERIIIIVNWKKYQSEYLRQKPYRKKRRSDKNREKRITNKVTNNDTGKVTNEVTDELHIEEKKGEENREEGRRGEKSTKNISPNDNFSDSPLHSNSTPSFDERKLTIKEQFIGLLKGCKEYPFDEAKDSLLFDITVTEHPNIDIIKQTLKKISWWRDHPDALKANPREKLEEWFKEEAEFQKRGGPQKIGEIIKEIEDPDHRRFLKGLLK